jgi:putative transcriptional regulator
MDKEHFDQLVKAVRQMNRHMAGKVVRGAKTTELAEPDVRAIREAAKISQSQFARLIGVNLRTLQNWEQRRTRPSVSSAGIAQNCSVRSKVGDQSAKRLSLCE